MAAQHLPRDLVRPSSRFQQLAQSMKKLRENVALMLKAFIELLLRSSHFSGKLEYSFCFIWSEMGNL